MDASEEMDVCPEEMDASERKQTYKSTGNRFKMPIYIYYFVLTIKNHRIELKFGP